MRLVRGLAVALSLLAVLSACESPPTQLLVIVDADPLVRARARGLRVRIWGRARGDDGFPSVGVLERSDEVRLNGWPVRYAIAPQDRDPSRLWRFEATALDGADAFVITRAISGYTEGETEQVVLFLRDSCIDRLCEADLNSTCDPISLGCMDATLADGERRPYQDGGTYDAGERDACMSDADCDDDLECTVDLCAGGLCLHRESDALCPTPACGSASCNAGICEITPRDADCDDGLDCTVDACRADGTCGATPDNARCTAASGGVCDATDGCQYDTCDTTTCFPQGCLDGVCDGNTCRRPSICTATEMCCAGACVADRCDDGLDCTLDACGAGGCEHDPAPRVGMSCDDGDACTFNTVCDTTGACGGGRDCAMQAGPCEVGLCGPDGCTLMDQPDGTVCGPPMPCRNRCAAGACVPQTCVMDAGVPDAGRRDAGRVDAGGVDGGGPCAACAGLTCCGGMTCCDTASGMFMCSGSACVPRDAGRMDAGPRDAGTDAGAMDAGGPLTPDGGLDAGGATDGGSISLPDATPPPV